MIINYISSYAKLKNTVLRVKQYSGMKCFLEVFSGCVKKKAGIKSRLIIFKT